MKSHPKASSKLVCRRVEDVLSLNSEVYASIVDYLDDSGLLRVPPFDAAICSDAILAQISRPRIDWFIETARKERGFPLETNIQTKALFSHLNLIENDSPLNAAIILFGKNPQRFHRSAETKCIFCHGTEYQRPFLSQQIYTGDLFEQVNHSLDFVLSKINRSVGTRATSVTAKLIEQIDALRGKGWTILNVDLFSTLDVFLLLYMGIPPFVRNRHTCSVQKGSGFSGVPSGGPGPLPRPYNP
ncbi:MAG: hypothetical protein J7L71_03530 [Spirochaetaceae bacterium]|nr:hypothetical protein [Spirochaetaceae bacterium]